jgi:catechol 2,3-dioxygenase-like lactoylglutathione lyase family enzyme
VICAAADPARFTGVWDAIGATTTELEDGRLLVGVGGSTIEYVPDASARSGISGIEISVDQPTEPGRTRLSGIDVTLTGPASAGDTPDADDREGTAPEHVPALRLEHVAIVVHDLDASEREWSALIGVRAKVMAVHPISDGAFGAARITLGDQMIELLSPVDGRRSSVAGRLSAHGEGPITMAVPVADLSVVTARLEAVQARILRQPPHVLVHPRDIGGVLVQLTPRVEH